LTPSKADRSTLVLAVPTADLPAAARLRFTLIDDDLLTSIVGAGRFMPRAEVELDDRFKQVIPYVVLKFEQQVYCYTRGKASSEKRLVARTSIGIGGHVEWWDDSLFDDPLATYRRAAQREVGEEVVVSSLYQERIVAIINDDDSDVGRVHLGVVHVWNLEHPRVRRREQKIAAGGFRSVDDLRRSRGTLETWSSIALEALNFHG
jgi:predicted NUDIX family phosphoesterase